MTLLVVRRGVGAVPTLDGPRLGRTSRRVSRTGGATGSRRLARDQVRRACWTRSSVTWPRRRAAVALHVVDVVGDRHRLRVRLHVAVATRTRWSSRSRGSRRTCRCRPGSPGVSIVVRGVVVLVTVERYVETKLLHRHRLVVVPADPEVFGELGDLMVEPPPACPGQGCRRAVAPAAPVSAKKPSTATATSSTTAATQGHTGPRPTADGGPTGRGGGPSTRAGSATIGGTATGVEGVGCSTRRAVVVDGAERRGVDGHVVALVEEVAHLRHRPAVAPGRGSSCGRAPAPASRRRRGGAAPRARSGRARPSGSRSRRTACARRGRGRAWRRATRRPRPRGRSTRTPPPAPGRQGSR